MTAAVILQQAQEKKFPLADPVSKFLPNVPNGDKISSITTLGTKILKKAFPNLSIKSSEIIWDAAFWQKALLVHIVTIAIKTFLSPFLAREGESAHLAIQKQWLKLLQTWWKMLFRTCLSGSS
jgi:hypothetical protein